MTRNRTLRFASTAIAGLSPFLLPLQQALAQTANSAPPAAPYNSAAQGTAVGEILVTARKVSESIQKVPISVTAVTGAQLETQSITTIANLQSLAPGLYIQQGSDDPQSIAVTMRGRKQDDQSMAVDPAISLSVDGLVVPRLIGMQGSMIDIQRVEVLRGPQGTLVGRNSTGGAINIFTNDPTDQYSGSIDVTGGDYGTWNVLGIANIPLSENLAARFVAERGANGGYERTALGWPLGDQSNEYYRAKLKWTGSHNWQAVLSGHYEHENSSSMRMYFTGLQPDNYQGSGLPEGGLLTLETEAEYGVSEAQAIAMDEQWVAQKRPWYTLSHPDVTPGFAAGNDLQFRSDIERWDVGLNISGDLTDDVQFHSISGVEGLRRKSGGDLPGAIMYFREFPRSSGLYYSQEFQLIGHTPKNVSWVVGAYGGYETGRDGQTVFFLPAAFGTGATQNDNGILNTTVAAYGQATWEFIPNWRLTGGIRYTKDTREVDANAFNVDMIDPTIHQCVTPAPGFQFGDPAVPGSTQCPRPFKASFGEPTWLVSLDHQLTANILLYGKVATGYRSGGSNADGGTNDSTTYLPFKPETNIEYEAGFKSTFFDRRLRLNADVYWSDYSDLQVQNQLEVNGTFETIETNAATARIRGVEVEGDFVVGGGLTLHASTAYTDAHYLKFPDLDAAGNPIDRSHEQFSVPKWTYTVSANYTRPTGVGDASAELDWAWKSAVDFAPSSAFRFSTQPGYGLLNARLNLHVDAWNMDVAVFGQNLTNEYYFDQGGTNLGPGFDVTAAYVGGPPRTFGIELVKKFGG